MVITAYIYPVSLHTIPEMTALILDYCKVGTAGTITFLSLHYSVVGQRCSFVLDAPDDTDLPFLHAFIQHHLFGGFSKGITLSSYTYLAEAL